MQALDGAKRGWRWTNRVASAAAVVVLSGAALLFVLRPLSITLPAAGLDSSWMVVLGEAATRPARWGVDLAFTYGPASAWVTRYFTDGYVWTALPGATLVALVNGLALVLLARSAAAGRRFGALLVIAAVAAEIAALGAELALDQDSFYFALAFVLLLLDLVRQPGRRLPALTVLLGAALLGAAALAKTSFGIAALGSLALADARAAWIRRRPPVLVPVFLAAALASFLLHGQRIGDLPAYLTLQIQEATGYGEAMYLAPGRIELTLFGCAAAALTAIAGYFGAPGRLDRVAVALGTGFLLAIGAKAGFIRADTHTQIAWSLLGLMALAIAIARVLPRSRLGAALLGASALGVVWVVGPLFLLVASDQPVALRELPGLYGDMGASLAGETAAWNRLLVDPVAFETAAQATKAENWAGIRAAEPLPKLAGRVDILPSEQSAVLAAGLDYQPRPSFQDYSTYTAGLIAANTAFYDGPQAPEWVIFGVGGLDDRYPNSTEGALWPGLLRRYEPQGRIGPSLLLHRRAVSLPEVLGPPVRLEAALGRPVALPFPGPVFARVTVRKTLLGRLAAAVFRPPALSLRVALGGGNEQTYRFIPALADGGFLLSPMLTDVDGFAGLAFGAGRGAEGVEVTGLTVGGSPWTRLFYDKAIAVELRSVTVPEAPRSPAAATLAGDIAQGLPWRRLARTIGPGLSLEGDRLSVPAPTALSVPTSGAHRLSLGFGIADGAWTDGKTSGVCFAVKASPSAPTPMWRRCLDPKDVAADRGMQSAEVALPPGVTTVTAETTCLRGCAWGWSYWSDISPRG